MKKICYVSTLAVTIKSFFVPQLKYLAEKGFSVTVICSPDNELANILGDKVRYIPVKMPRGISVFGSLKAIGKLKKIFKKEQFDLVQYSTPNAAFYASIAAKSAKVKIRNYHLMGLRYLGATGIKKKLLYLIEKKACANSTHIECVSKSNMDFAVKEKLFNAKKCCVIWNGSSGGLDLNRFDYNKREIYRKEIRSLYNIGEDEFVFGFVGRITLDKGVNEILGAFSKIQNARLMMIGKEEGVKTLDASLYEKSKTDSNVIYTGNVDDIEKYYCALDVLLFPSYREGFGNAVIEAAAMGTPAIISDIPGPVDAAKKDVTALVVEKRSESALLSAMRELVSDKEKLNELSRAAVKFVSESFDEKILLDKIFERKNNLFEKADAKKVAIINRTNFKNYGSVLQCYALCNAVKSMGYECELVWEKGSFSANNDFRLKKLLGSAFKLLFHPSLMKKTLSMVKSVNERVISEATIKLFDSFVEQNIERKYLTYGQLQKAAKNEYCKFICGSDQVWCSTTLYVDPLMYLRFAPEYKRIAYAPSIGRDFVPKYNSKKMKKYISEIPALSIREETGRQVISSLIDKDLPVVLDPTLLFDREAWDKLKTERQFDYKYILCYFLDEPTETIQRQIQEISEKTGLKIVALNSKLQFIDNADYPDCGPSEFITLVSNAEYVFTDSYHGMLFSIIYEKRFVSVERDYKEYNQSSRQLSILKELKLEDRFIPCDGQLSLTDIDYSGVNKVLAERRAQSLGFLKNALEGEGNYGEK